MTECNETKLSSLYYDNELDAQAHTKFKEHLKHCVHCHKAVQGYQQVSSILRHSVGHNNIVDIKNTNFNQRLHNAVDKTANDNTIVFAYRILSVAASILMVASTYLFYNLNNTTTHHATQAHWAEYMVTAPNTEYDTTLYEIDSSTNFSTWMNLALTEESFNE